MPISYGNYQKQLKLLPLLLNDDGTASITVRYGYVGESGQFEVAKSETFSISEADVSLILDAQPTAGLSRRDDLSLAVYAHLVQMGKVAAGDIS